MKIKHSLPIQGYKKVVTPKAGDIVVSNEDYQVFLFFDEYYAPHTIAAWDAKTSRLSSYEWVGGYHASFLTPRQMYLWQVYQEGGLDKLKQESVGE